MTLPVRFSAEAEAELESATAWYEDRRAGLGEEFLEAVERTIDQVAEWPLAGGLIEALPEDIEVRRAPVDRFPYHLAYLIEAARSAPPVAAVLTSSDPQPLGAADGVDQQSEPEAEFAHGVRAADLARGWHGGRGPGHAHARNPRVTGWS